MAAREETLPGLMLRNAQVRPTKPAMREKDLGIWRTYTWADYAAQVQDFALGLAQMGFGKGDKLVVIGDNRPRLYWAQVAAMSLGGSAVPVYQDAIASELVFVLADADTKVIVAEDQEQVDKILSVKGELASLIAVVYDDDRGMAHYDDPMLRSFADVQAAGAKQNAADFAKHVDALEPSAIAVMCYTSGTTGNPKGVMLSHRNLIETGKIFCANEDVRETDDFLAYLPMAWVGEAMYGMAIALIAGCSSNCPEAPETLERDLRELGPTGFVASPRGWETILSQLQVKANDTTGLKRWVYDTFRQAAVDGEMARAEGRSPSLGNTIKRALGEVLVYGPVRDQIGLRRARWCYTGGAPLGHDTFRFFRAIGVNLKQLYGSTEVSGLVSLQKDNKVNPDTSGPPCPGIDVKIGENSEILVKSAGVFQGYYKRDDATAEAFTADGYFRTGDAGVLDEKTGELLIIDRAKDVGTMADGTAYAPQFIENKLKFSAYISEAVSFGSGRDFVSVMVAIDQSTVGNWAEKKGIPFTNYMDLSQKQEVRDLIAGEVARINTSLPDSVRVKRFLLLAKDLDADDSEVTRTRKLRRAFIAERYAPVIDAFYNNLTEVDLRTEVTFEDGRRSHVEARLLIQDAA
jgi:long-chain acyl-CoA synthetase